MALGSAGAGNMSRKQSRKAKAKAQPEGRPFSEGLPRPPPQAILSNAAAIDMDMPLEGDDGDLGEYQDYPRNIPFDCNEGLRLLEERWRDAMESSEAVETVPASNAKFGPKVDIAKEMQRVLERHRAARGQPAD